MGSKPIGISASRGAAILGQSKYGDRFETWLKIMEDREPGFSAQNGYTKPEFVDNNATRWGHALEKWIIKFAEHVRDTEITGQEKFSTHDKYDFITCHQDGEYSPNILHEGKTTNARTFFKEWGEPGTDHIPRDYIIQTQHQMMCTGAQICTVSVLVIPKMQEELANPEDLGSWQVENIAAALYDMGYFYEYTITRNDRLISTMEKSYVKFWNENVLGRKPPEPTSFEWVKKSISNPVGFCIATEQVHRWSVEHSTMAEEIKKTTEKRKEIGMKILQFMRDNSDEEIDDDGVERLVLLGGNGERLKTYNGKQFR